jgi:hypothetical protein
MDLKQAAIEYEKATSEFLTLSNSIEEVALDLTDGDGWSPRQVFRLTPNTHWTTQTRSEHNCRKINRHERHR